MKQSIESPTGRRPVVRTVRLDLAATLVALAALAPQASAVTLGISPDGRFFTLDGNPTFLNGVSYYGAQTITTASFRTLDLNHMVANGVNWIRVWGYWRSPTGEDVSILTHDGFVRATYMSRFKALITECDAFGIIVDCSLNRNADGDWVGARNQAEHLTAVQTLATELLPYRNVYIDVSNERDVGDDRYVSLSECGQLISAIKAIDPYRLCTASSGPGSQSQLADFRNVARMDFITPHLCRDAGCPAQTLGTVQQYVGWMKNLGWRIPVHLQEPFRRGYGPWEPLVDDFLRDCSGGKIAEAAGWCLHNGSDHNATPYRSFDMGDAYGRLYTQLDSIEQSATSSLNDTIAGTSANLRRYQVEYAEQLQHSVGRRENSAWSANVAQDGAGYMTSGPNITTLPTGQHTATWRLNIDNNSADNAVVLTIDVTKGGGAIALASLQIRRQDFALANTWQEFSLPFVSETRDVIEFRTYWHDQAKINLDWITLSVDETPVYQEPIIAEVVPNPDTVRRGREYSKQLTLEQGSVPIAWTVEDAPAGTTVGIGGLVSGWTPGVGDLGSLVTFAISATNTVGSDTVTWQVQVLSMADFDLDGDVDQVDFGHFQACISGTGSASGPACQDADLEGDGAVDGEDLGLFLQCFGGPGTPPAF